MTPGLLAIKEIVLKFVHRRHFSYIKDEYLDIRMLKEALQKEGLESCNLVIGIDFSNCNRNIEKHSLSRHGASNPFEHAISIIGNALAGYDEDNKIPCYGFGDALTRDEKVFSFFQDGAPCDGIEGVLTRYRELRRRVKFSEWNSFAPIIYAAIDEVKRSGGLYHILAIIANGQVTGGNLINSGRQSNQVKNTIDAIVYASSFPLSIVVVGVGDGPWDSMRQFDDSLKSRKFDNFQFVNYSEIVAKYSDQNQREMALALAALMEIPQQYKAIKQLGPIGRGREKKAHILPPP